MLGWGAKQDNAPTYEDGKGQGPAAADKEDGTLFFRTHRSIEMSWRRKWLPRSDRLVVATPTVDLRKKPKKAQSMHANTATRGGSLCIDCSMPAHRSSMAGVMGRFLRTEPPVRRRIPRLSMASSSILWNLSLIPI